MNSKLYVVIVLVVAVALAGYLYSRSNIQKQIAIRTESSDIAAVGDPVFVNMDETAFSPNTITIEKNTKVIFKNTGNEAHWPASDVHPTHGIYPEFDPQRPIPPGESWSFVFTKVGKWRMHDHLMPRILGTIVVTE